MQAMGLKRALFLDRDGVINADVGYAYRSEQIEFLPGIFERCRNACAQGYLIIIVTNQSGIGRGYYSDEDFHLLMRWMLEQFTREGCPITAYYYCPHTPEDHCECRKPKPGMIWQAAGEHGIDLANSILIGDKPTDIEAGSAAGIKDCRLVSA